MATENETFISGPAAVYTQLEHRGQRLTVVKLQEAYAADPATLLHQLTAALRLSPSALLLVLPSEGDPLLGQGEPEELYHDYLSTNTAAVVEQTWQPLEYVPG